MSQEETGNVLSGRGKITISSLQTSNVNMKSYFKIRHMDGLVILATRILRKCLFVVSCSVVVRILPENEKCEWECLEDGKTIIWLYTYPQASFLRYWWNIANAKCINKNQDSIAVFHLGSPWVEAANIQFPDSKFHGANMGSTLDLSAPDEPHVVTMNLAIREVITYLWAMEHQLIDAVTRCN